MNLSNIVIVLDHPDESRNIGAACRAMANNDISDLRIVGKKENYDLERIYTLAIHAKDIFDNARFYNDINEATADCTISAGTTRRRGKKRGKLLLPEEFAELAGAKTENAKVAIVFGNERAGLSDEQLDMCTLGVCIPSSENFGSLNLSHAVQILCYQMFREEKGNLTGYTPLTLQRLDKTVDCITDNLQKIGFFKMPGREDMENFWRSVLARASLSESEAQYLEKTFTKMSGLAAKNEKSNNDITS
ncbi:MAG: RNA methyltransferase [Treponema sp.]|nr:RNA methyltransferase [Treponema sp.]